MPSSSEDDSTDPLQQHSAQQLTSLLRRASNRLEMLLNPGTPHHEDDAERQRVLAMTEPERAFLKREAMKAITDVRAEFRRRLSIDS